VDCSECLFFVMQSGDVLSVACFIAMLSVVVLGAILPSVVMLNVMAPLDSLL
jgi:hypothetical protein